MYFVFVDDHCYPGGGMDDLKGSFPPLADALQGAHINNRDWWHIDIIDATGGLLVIA